MHIGAFARLGLFLAFLLPVVSGAARAQETIDVDLDGATVRFVIPAGYCLLNRANPNDRAVLDFYQEQRANASRIVAFFLECNALARLREDGVGDVLLLHDYGYYLVETDEEGVVVYSGLTRAEYAREFATAFQKIDSETITATMKDRLADLEAAANSSAEFQQLGVTDYDDNAAYLLIVADTKLPGHSQLITGAGAMTLVEERAIAIMFSRFFDDAATIDAVQHDARTLLQSFLAANPD